MKFRERLKKIFVPQPGSPRWMYILPYAILLVLVAALLAGGTYGWDYTNSPKFCGTTCHTMPPQDATYKVSPHANVYCTECHIGRAFVGEQFARKSEDIREIYATVFKTYTFPITASRSRPALETCEKCHKPETFSDDRLRVIDHFKDDEANTQSSVYLIMKTGGGEKREGLGRGIHWHIANKVLFYSPNADNQDIPYVRVLNEDGTTTEYVDVESNFDSSKLDESQLKTMDCTTCHNRVSHNFMPPSQSVDLAMSRGLIDPSIPSIHKKAVDVLSAKYASPDEAKKAISALEDDYKANYADFYKDNAPKIQNAIAELQAIYDRTVFPDQKVDWTTHPNNLGHINSPGCFRCHDGKHLNSEQQAVRLECNLCHSIPIVANAKDFVTRIEISRGPEPESHLNANWISLHNKSLNPTCANCHTTEGAGGTSNTSFCSNEACHGTVFTYAGFDAPALREILKLQIPTPEPTASAPSGGNPTYDSTIGPIFANKCVMCHGQNASAGLNLTTYADTMKGGTDGPVIIAGDSANSKLVVVQSSQHFANLLPEELQFLIQWIDAGAPEK